MFNDMIFLDDDNGWAVGWTDEKAGILFHTTDGGQTWSEQSVDVPDATWTKLAWADSTTGFVIGFGASGQPLLLRTNDGGQTWQVSAPANISGQMVELIVQPGGALWALSVVYRPRSYHVWHSADGEAWNERAVAPAADAQIALWLALTPADVPAHIEQVTLTSFRPDDKADKTAISVTTFDNLLPSIQVQPLVEFHLGVFHLS